MRDALARLRRFVVGLFTRHELWVLDEAGISPRSSIFLVMTLFVWVIPLLPILILFQVMAETWPWVMLLPGILLGVAAAFFFAPWFFNWYAVCLSLMFGDGGLAASKRERVLQRLAE